MKESRAKTILKYVLPTVLSQCAFFLFTIVDGIFVGRGLGTDALGAVNLAQPLVMVIGAVFMLTTIGGVTITAIRMGRKDYEGANQSFMHANAATVIVATFFTVIGTVFTKPLAVLLCASGVYLEMVCDYLFWYTAFTIPSALAATLQGFGRNDCTPVFVMVSTIVSTALNIFLDWLFASVNTVLSAYLYSTKRTKEAVAVNVLRGLIFTPLCVVALSFFTNGALFSG